MTQLSRLGLGCMGMNMSNADRSLETIHYALDQGINLFNTGDFYGGGDSEMILREAFRGVARDKYWLNVKFGILTRPGGGIYGLDVKPFNIKAHLTYDLHRLGVDYIDLYEPARLDEAIPVEDVIGELADLVKEGYIREIGLTQVTAERIDRAVKVHPIRMLEVDYSIANRVIETDGVLETARRNGIDLLAFGVLSHGVLTETEAGDRASTRRGISPEEKTSLLREVREIAAEKQTTLSNLMQAYVYAKNPDMRAIVGTTRAAHLQEAIQALQLTLTDEEVARVEAAFPAERFQGMGTRNPIFQDGRIVGG